MLIEISIPTLKECSTWGLSDDSISAYEAAESRIIEEYTRFLGEYTVEFIPESFYHEHYRILGASYLQEKEAISRINEFDVWAHI